MNNKFSKFQVITLGVFVLFIILGVAAFALYRNSASTKTLAPITVWGTFPKDIFDTYTAKVSNNSSQQIDVTYVEKSIDQFSLDFVSL